MSNITALEVRSTIAAELALQRQLNARMRGALISLIEDLRMYVADHGPQRFVGKRAEYYHFTSLTLAEKAIAIPASEQEAINFADYQGNAVKLWVERRKTKVLRPALWKLVNEIDEKADPYYFQNWRYGLSLCYQGQKTPASMIAALQCA